MSKVGIISRLLLLLICKLKHTLCATHSYYASNGTYHCTNTTNTDICHLYCDETNQYGISLDCGSSKQCIFHCTNSNCLESGTLNALQSDNLLVASVAENCVFNAIINVPNHGNATISTTINDGLSTMTVNSGTNTQNIKINCNVPSASTQCKDITVNAETAQYLEIYLGTDGNVRGTGITSTSVIIKCPINSQYMAPFNSPYTAPCIIDMSLGGTLRRTDIYADYGIPRDLQIISGVTSFIDPNVYIICRYGTTAVDGIDSADNCWITHNPTIYPTVSPTKAPTNNPITNNATKQPTIPPTNNPTPSPTVPPTNNPITAPTNNPTQQPTTPPTATNSPSSIPTNNPIYIVPTTASPTTNNPTPSPTNIPTASRDPTIYPTDSANSPTFSPSNIPTPSPTNNPTPSPTANPTPSPTEQPLSALDPIPTPSPTNNPTPSPTSNPTPSTTSNPIPSPTVITKQPTTSKQLFITSRSTTITPTNTPTASTTNSATGPSSYTNTETESFLHTFIDKLIISLSLIVVICCMVFTITIIRKKRKGIESECDKDINDKTTDIVRGHTVIQNTLSLAKQIEVRSQSSDKIGAKLQNVISFSDVLMDNIDRNKIDQIQMSKFKVANNGECRNNNHAPQISPKNGDGIEEKLYDLEFGKQNNSEHENWRFINDKIADLHDKQWNDAKTNLTVYKMEGVEDALPVTPYADGDGVEYITPNIPDNDRLNVVQNGSVHNTKTGDDDEESGYEIKPNMIISSHVFMDSIKANALPNIPITPMIEKGNAFNSELLDIHKND